LNGLFLNFGKDNTLILKAWGGGFSLKSFKVRQFLGSVFQKLIRRWSWIVLVTLVLLIRLASGFPAFIEQYYTYGAYPIISKTQRLLLGWIPLSIGDILYGFIIVVIIVKLVQVVIAVFRKRMSWAFVGTGLKQLVFFMMVVYVLFYLFWGLNYSRQGIANQLELEAKPYTIEELDTVARLLQGFRSAPTGFTVQEA
jgi:hypothetical protein